MSVINLRRARKQRQRAAKSAEADQNRKTHGIRASVRKAAKVETDKQTWAHDAHRLDAPK